MIKKWELLDKETVYESPYITLFKETLRRGDGKVITDFYSVKRRDAVFIVALTTDQQVPLVHQYKNGVREVIWELPAGFIDKDENPENAARRELLEETGFEVEDLEVLGAFVPNTGVSSNQNHVFLGVGAEKTREQSLDEHEEIEVELFPLTKLVEEIRKGNSLFVDTQSQLGILLAWEKVSK